MAPRTIPLRHVQKIICHHSVQLTTQLLGQLWERGIDFITLNSRFSQRSFALRPAQHNQVARRCAQYRWQDDEQQSLVIAKQFCRHRLANNLKILDADDPVIEQIKNTHNLMQHCTSLNKLRGLEGLTQRLVFNYWRERLPAQLEFTKREKRPARDPVNSLLSLAYTLVHEEAVRQCIRAGLDSQLGFYHRTSFGRHSLACDLMEPVRPYCEQWVFEQFIAGVFNKSHFTKPDKLTGSCVLGKQGRVLFYQAVDAQLKVWQRKLQAYARWLSRNLDRQNHTEGDLNA